MKKIISYATPFLVVGVAVFLFMNFYNKDNSSVEDGNKAYVSRDFKQAISDYEKNRNSLSQEELLKLADSYYRSDQLDKAVALYESMTKTKEITHEQLAEFYFKVGEWEENRKNIETATSFYEKAMKKSQSYSLKLKVKKKIGYFISNNPTKENIDKGIRYLTEVSQTNPEKDNLDLLYRLGNLHYLVHEDGMAIQYWEKALQVNKQYTPAYEKIGMVLLDSGEYQDAREYFQKALNVESRNWKALYGMAEVQFNSGSKSTALQYYQQALSINPDHTPSRYQLAEIYLEKGDKTGATQEFYQIVKRDPDSPLGKKAKEKLDELIPKVE